MADNCDVRANLPELNAGIGAGLVGSTVSTTSPYCHVAYGWLTQLRGLGSYVIPKIDTQVSAVFQSKPGLLLSANYAMPAADVARFLGRPPSGNVPNVTFNLIEPGSLYGDRINQLDLRVAKNFRFGSTRSMVSLDLYNVMNASAGPDLQPDLRSERHLVAGQLRPDRPTGSHQRRFQLLARKAEPGLSGPGYGLVLTPNANSETSTRPRAPAGSALLSPLTSET